MFDRLTVPRLAFHQTRTQSCARIDSSLTPLNASMVSSRFFYDARRAKENVPLGRVVDRVTLL